MSIIYLDSRSLSDKEDGSKEHPFKSFDFAYKQANDNDTIWDLEPKVVKTLASKNFPTAINWPSNEVLDGFKNRLGLYQVD